MNKLMGFYELQEMAIPSIPWKIYNKNVKLNPDLLWTIRTAVIRGNDINLPKQVGVDSVTATKFANNQFDRLGNNGIVIYYPFFIANKSGILDIHSDRIVIEAVEQDLWNLTTNQITNCTLVLENDLSIKSSVNADFLSKNEVRMLTKYVPEIRKTFKDDLFIGKSVLLEWSFANKCDKTKKEIGNSYLVFYEARTIQWGNVMRKNFNI